MRWGYTGIWNHFTNSIWFGKNPWEWANTIHGYLHGDISGNIKPAKCGCLHNLGMLQNCHFNSESMLLHNFGLCGSDNMSEPMGVETSLHRAIIAKAMIRPWYFGVCVQMKLFAHGSKQWSLKNRMTMDHGQRMSQDGVNGPTLSPGYKNSIRFYILISCPKYNQH